MSGSFRVRALVVTVDGVRYWHRMGYADDEATARAMADDAIKSFADAAYVHSPERTEAVYVVLARRYVGWPLDSPRPPPATVFDFKSKRA